MRTGALSPAETRRRLEHYTKLLERSLRLEGAMRDLLDHLDRTAMPSDGFREVPEIEAARALLREV